MVSVSNLSVYFGARALFSGITFFIGPRDRIGLVGKNGAGKTTLLRTLNGEQPAGEGNVSLAKGTTIGYLPQEMKHSEESTVYEEASSAFAEIQNLNDRFEFLTHAITETTDYLGDAYSLHVEELEAVSHRLELIGSGNTDEKIERVLKGLGFTSPDMKRKMSEFSGGWKMRVELGKILLQNPDLLLLDEPTNHLDIESIQWLEDFLIDYPGAVLLISHDRTFLDSVTKRTVEISKGKIYDYKFSYSKYIVQRRDEIERQKQAAKNQQRYIEDTQKLIDKFRAKKDKAAFAQSLIKKLERLEKIEVDDFDSTKVNIRFPHAPHAGKVIVTGEKLGKAYGSLRLFKDVELMIHRNEKIALVGKNGVGKSTLVRMLIGKETHDGTIKPGHNVSVGYYAQNQSDLLDGGKTVFETVDDEAIGDMRQQVRNLLGAFLFSGDDIDKKVRVLSGGEKARLAFCKLLLTPYNFLVLDEPTNHLDLASKEVLKAALKKYDGTLLVVSHDRDFLHGLTKTVYEIKEDRIKMWQGDILDFLKEKKAQSISLFEANAKSKAQNNAPPKNSDPANTLSYEEKKEAEKKKRKLKNTVTRCEKEIETTENAIAAMSSELAAIDYTNHEKSQPALSKYEDLKKQLGLLMDEWQLALDELGTLE